MNEAFRTPIVAAPSENSNDMPFIERRAGGRRATDVQPVGEVGPEDPYQILSSPELRIQYLHLTDELINKMVKNQTEVAVFLDKSARPVAWLMHNLWDQLAPHDSEGNIPPEPAIKFLNVDREQWGPYVGRSENDVIDINRIPTDLINDLRKVFAVEDAKLNEDAHYEGPSLLTNKRVSVVDEVSVSGDTLSISMGVFRRAFPDTADLQGIYWMHGHVKQDPKTGVRMNTKLPVWYSDKESTGRGVADRDTTKSQDSPSLRQRIGRYWLSTLFRDGPDRTGQQLRRETKQIADDLRDKRIPYKPAAGWMSYPSENTMQRVRRLNGMSLEQFVELRRISDHNDGILQDRYIDYHQNTSSSDQSKP